MLAPCFAELSLSWTMLVVCRCKKPLDLLSAAAFQQLPGALVISTMDVTYMVQTPLLNCKNKFSSLLHNWISKISSARLHVPFLLG